MTGLLANLVGAASAVLRPRADGAVGRPMVGADDGFASALSSAMGPRRTSDAHADRPTGEADVARDALETKAAEAGEERRAAARAAEKRAAADRAEEAEAATKAAEASPAEGTPAEHPAAAEGTEEARSPREITRSLDGLDPEFRARLERVIQRMETEHGHRVQLVETVRDQARQEYLYAQGRTRPGPVVTWTTSSNHTKGRAADLLVDGTYDNPLAMVRLARIAREEGLRTLGSKDPGHVELPVGVRLERFSSAADPSTSLLVSPVTRAAEAARGAAAAVGETGIADVARVAQVAEVATVATVAGAGDAPGGTMAADARSLFAAARAGVGGGATGGGHDRGRGESDPQQVELALDVAADSSARGAGGATAGAEGRSIAAAASEVRGAAGTFGAEAAERIARVLQLQDTASSRPLSQMVLRLENPMGGEDRIRVDLRGSSVGAALSVGDPVDAARLQSDLGQLQRALEARGLKAEHLSVSGLVPGRELTEAMRTALPADAGQRSSGDPGTQREGSNGRPGGEGRDADSDHPRRRPRREHQQERNT